MDKRLEAWTEERNNILRDLWDKGFSANQIAKQIGMTRNAVLGRKWRLGLASRAPVVITKTPRAPKPRKNAVVLIFKLPEMKQIPDQIVGKGIQLTELEEHHCRFPMADGTFCGHDKELKMVVNGNSIYRGSYCSYHHRICHQPPRHR